MSVLQTPFGASSTADEVASGIDLSGKHAVVTGASSGIGVETARVLADHGAAVTLAVRDTDAGASVAVGIRASTGNDAVDVRRLELADPESVASFVRGWDGPLDILINNAGVMAIPERTLTADEIELHFATNHLGHFSLATGLHGALRASGSARVVSLSSSAHLYCPVLFDDPTFAFVPYSPFLGYGQSKTANACSPSRPTAAGSAPASASTRSCRAVSPHGCSDISIPTSSRGRAAKRARARS